MSPIAAVAVADAELYSSFEMEEALHRARRVRLQYLADAIRQNAYPVEAREVASSMLRILGCD